MQGSDDTDILTIWCISKLISLRCISHSIACVSNQGNCKSLEITDGTHWARVKTHIWQILRRLDRFGAHWEDTACSSFLPRGVIERARHFSTSKWGAGEIQLHSHLFILLRRDGDIWEMMRMFMRRWRYLGDDEDVYEMRRSRADEKMRRDWTAPGSFHFTERWKWKC